MAKEMIGFFFLFLAVPLQCYGSKSLAPFGLLLREDLPRGSHSDAFRAVSFSSPAPLAVDVFPKMGLKENDKIESLPGQPVDVDFDQYSGYVTINQNAGRALFYYFVESPQNSSCKPLVLWLNGGPGCSSLGAGAMTELGPFRVSKDGKTLYRNQYAWNQEANVIFLESPVGVGFSYSNTSSGYDVSGDNRTAYDSYTFLVNWFERFPEYKTRDFFIAGESYAGHYVPQLAQLILHNNNYVNQTLINLKGIAIGNAVIDREAMNRGTIDFAWSHALLSDEIYTGIVSNCNFSSSAAPSELCIAFLAKSDVAIGNIYAYNIYASFCNSTSAASSISDFDPCSMDYVYSYLNIPQVQIALHANVAAVPYPWELCNKTLDEMWTDSPQTMLPIIQELMDNGIRVWIYSGDIDGRVPITSTRYAINKLGAPVKTPWYPWYLQNEVGGYVVGYQNLTFVTIRGSGHFVPSYQPARALAFFSSFIQGELPASS